MPTRLGRIARSWLSGLRRRIPFVGGDPFNLKSTDAIKDPEVREALKRWQDGRMTSDEFRLWLDEKWERDHPWGCY